MQKHVNLVDLVKSFPTNILLQNLASIQKRKIPIKFAHSAEKSENGSISNLSTMVRYRTFQLRLVRGISGGCTSYRDAQLDCRGRLFRSFNGIRRAVLHGATLGVCSANAGYEPHRAPKFVRAKVCGADDLFVNDCFLVLHLLHDGYGNALARSFLGE